jgi:signal transduction histidine kinase
MLKSEYRVLLVKNNQDDSRLMIQSLLKEGFTSVDVAHDHDEFLEFVDKNIYNLIILDESGACRKLKETLLDIVNDQSHDIDTSVIALLSDHSRETMKCLSEAGVYYYIFKPYNLQELILRMEVLMDKKSIQQIDRVNVEQLKMDAVGDMIAMIAHQWRQPLNSMATSISNIEVEILMDMLDMDDLTKTLSQMKKSIEYLSHTIDDFRYFFMPSKTKELATVSDIFEHSQGIIDMKLAHHRIMMITSEPHVKERFEVFKNEIMQVVINIINNAMDELVSREIKLPCIWVSSEKDSNFVYIKIRDNAGGISKDVIGKIFDPYFSTKKKKNGSGLGLYMSKMIIERHCEGEIYAKNVENGAEFTIKLPYKK